MVAKGKSKGGKRNYFRLEKMSEDIGMGVDRIIKILLNPNKNGLKNVQGNENFLAGNFHYPNLASAKEAYEKAEEADPQKAKAYFEWEWYSLKRVTKACNMSILLDALESVPPGSPSESLAFLKIASLYGYRGVSDLS